jgi:hypothetical protein
MVFYRIQKSQQKTYTVQENLDKVKIENNFGGLRKEDIS